ncbi:hypothetical protein [Litorisediminicola beolgyonensis]|uniref:DUF1488 family protein n=1 Tax=Litorisediminicola beolgyonensis TaxID=1173614 RepID=A0ABW3ZP22_9RHOB
MSVAVRGRDAAREAYRVDIDGQGALVPECLMESLRSGDRPSHQEAYEWIAAHRGAIERAVAARVRGERPRPPFDLVELLA